MVVKGPSPCWSLLLALRSIRVCFSSRFMPLPKMAVKKSVKESVFNFKIRWSLILAKLQVFTINDIERFFEGFSEGVCFQLQAVAGSVLAKPQVFFMNCCFGRLIKLILKQSVTINCKKSSNADFYEWKVTMTYGRQQTKGFIDNRPK